jgi:prevent-host-death family protein
MTVTVHQAKTHLSRLLHSVEAGEEVVICRGSVPIARLVSAVGQSSTPPPVGMATSEPFDIPSDAFSPLSDFELREWGL